ncbi:extracellular solute-binding protein [Oceanibacterium hippocampi]|uniref:Spermidine/putrescine-binding periplasmic protein n=1 Tax=Oceanibacterium hippocampi TaxID=745714 RepID=A0A1Y5TJY3_9PROT|nr:extracellular solute-binding protein [Oceanibacterium hippocampi]SLN65718.1 Spermidine/putrescine-binding periplasmic protein precursor [Oceanibacterium hippocampi]
MEEKLKLFQRMVVGCAAALLAGTATIAPAAAEGEVIIAVGGGLFERGLSENIATAFTRETGINVRFVAASPGERSARVKAMAEADRFEWDIVLSSERHARLLSEHLMEDVCEKADVAGKVVDGGCKSFGVLGIVGGLPLVYRADKFDGKKMTGWADFFDPEGFPGPRGLPNYGSPLVVIAPALLADGVPADKLYPIDFDRAFAVLDRIKPEIAVWWRSGDQSQQIFRSEEAIAGQLWGGRALGLVGEGMPLEVIWDGAPADEAYWVVLKKGPNQANAVKFLNHYFSSTDGHSEFYAMTNWDTANRAYLEGIPAGESSGHPGLFVSKMLKEDYDWSVPNADETLTRWNEWLSR